jgi:hypothetical protein
VRFLCASQAQVLDRRSVPTLYVSNSNTTRTDKERDSKETHMYKVVPLVNIVTKKTVGWDDYSNFCPSGRPSQTSGSAANTATAGRTSGCAADGFYRTRRLNMFSNVEPDSITKRAAVITEACVHEFLNHLCFACRLARKFYCSL